VHENYVTLTRTSIRRIRSASAFFGFWQSASDPANILCRAGRFGFRTLRIVRLEAHVIESGQGTGERSLNPRSPAGPGWFDTSRAQPSSIRTSFWSRLDLRTLISSSVRLLDRPSFVRRCAEQRLTHDWSETTSGAEAMDVRPVSESARGVVWAAALPTGGPSGGFFRDGRPLP
jgi:hypothetical protein